MSARILIADDHELVRQGMRAILSREPGWEVCAEAETGRQALDKALELKPDLLILDLGLPELNGLEVTRQVRRSLAVPILIVTVHDEDEILREAIAAGANGYVLKADAGRILAAAVRAILRHGEYFSETLRPSSDAGLPAAEPGTSPPPAWTQGASERLTAREREVLQLLAEGRSNKEIASALGITAKTVETHRARIMAKLGFHSMSELVRYAIRNRVIEP